MSSQAPTGSYGTILFFAGEPNPIHPDDRDKVTDYNYKNYLYYCTGLTSYGAYAVLIASGQHPFRARVEHFRPTRDPEYWIGDAVRVKDVLGRWGVIYRTGIHIVKAKYLYYIRVNGTRKSSHYYTADDLERIDTVPDSPADA